MPLPTTVRFNPGLTDLYGIGLMLVPSDAHFQIEIQRAPDDGTGHPNVGAAVSIETAFGPVPLSGAEYTDHVTNTTGKLFYRARHVRTAWNPGPWTPWTDG